MGRVFELGGVRFGSDQSVAVQRFDPGTAAWRTQDTPRPMGSGVRFGRDYVDGPLWSWEMFTDTWSESEALDAQERLEQAWHPEEVTNPGAVVPLKYTLAGRDRVVFGRPRRFSGTPADDIVDGVLPIVADFQLQDLRHYDTAVRRVQVSLVPTSQGGLVMPAVLPWTFGGSGVRTEVVQVSGSAPSWLRVRIHGPVDQPVVRIGDVEFGWRGRIAEGNWVEGSGWPWERTALTDTGVSAAGNLTRLTSLEDLRLAPGAHRVEFTGRDVANLARVEVSWQDAWHSL